MPTQAAVQAYYGQELTGTADLKTSACCDADAVPDWLRPLLARIHPDVLARYYGCGLVCPPLLEGCRILDLGCGTGRDVYALAQLVGPSGSVVGVDMTAEQLAVAREHLAFHAEQFGYANVSFLEGTIEALEALPLEPGSFDVVVSNCVLNLSTNKAAVLQGVKRLLKPGGEMYFSDVYVDRRLPEAVRRDPVLYGECLGGALYWNDFLRLAKGAGFPDPRLVSDRELQITEPALAPLVGEARSLGLFGALELVPRKTSRDFFPERGSVGTRCRDICIRNGLVMRAVWDTMIVAPPLVITHAEIDELVSKVVRSLDDLHHELRGEGRV